MPSKYENGKIYKIYSESANLTYYGSTCTPLCKRLKEHKTYPKGKYTSSLVLENDDATIILVEEYPCKSKKELYKREGYYQKNFECVNIRIAGIGRKESSLRYSRKNKQKKKEYWNKNREYFCIKKKEYYLKNKEKILAKGKELIKCECGIEIRKSGISSHRKSNRHKICLESGIEGYEQYKKDESKRLLKLRRERNRDKQNANRRERQKNSPIITCGCGKSFKSINMKGHCKSKFHQKWLLSQ